MLTRHYLLAVLLLASLIQAPAAANGFSLGSYPGPGETLTSVPQEFRLESPGADEPGEVRLLSLSSGSVIPPSRSAILRRGETIWYPPTLEQGTYVLEWSYLASGRRFEEVVHFNVSRPSHSVVLKDFRVPPPAAMSAAVLVLAAGLRRRYVRFAVVPAALLPTAALALQLPMDRSLAESVLPLLLAALAALLPPASTLLLGFSAAYILVPATSSLTAFAFAALLGSVLAHALELLQGGARRPAFSVLALSSLAAVALRLGSEAFSTAHGSAVSAITVVLVVSAMLSATRWGEKLALVRTSALVVAVWAASLLSLPAYTASPASNAASVPATCFSRGDYLSVQRCLESAYSESAFRSGVRGALEDLDALIRANPQARFHCHASSHAIGRAAFDITGSIPDAFSSGFDVCDFGFFHGVVEASAAGMDDDAFAIVMVEACPPLLPQGDLLFMQCVHGLGHAAARRTNNNMVAGLEFCDILRDAPMPEGMRKVALNGCGTGVTMEWFAVTGLVADPAEVASPAVSRQRDVCFFVEERWQPECFEYVGNTLDPSRAEESLLELADWCRASPFPDSCATGLMRSAAGLSLPSTLALRVCSAAVPGDVGSCVFDFLVGLATTVHYSVAAVPAACSSLPEYLREGAGSVCSRAAEQAADVLAAGGTILPG